MMRAPGSRDGSSGNVGRVIVVVCAFSLLLNGVQFTRRFSASIELDEEIARLRRDVAAATQRSRCPETPPTPCKCPSAAGEPAAIDEDASPAAEIGAAPSSSSNEIGWELGLARVASKTPNTVYDPAEDKKLMAHPKRYGRSPVPKGSWRVRVGDNKWVTMDEVAFAYDVWFEENQRFQYMSWMGVYVQQDPIDAFAIQDMLWRVKPDLIVEIGTNTGGGAIFYATIMKAYNPQGKIVTLDVKDISNWHKKTTSSCPQCHLATEHAWWNDGMITFIKGRVTEQATRDKVQPFVDKATKVLVIEDASHRYPDTLENIEATWHWVSKDSYLLVQDTKMDRFVSGLGRKYGGYKFGPMRSVDEFIAKHSEQFVIDRRFEYLLYSQHHRGWLLRK